MATNPRPGAVIFTGDKEGLARFYQAMTGWQVLHTDRHITALGSEEFELVIHVLAGEPRVKKPAPAREDVYIKPFFPVTSLAEARKRAEAFGGRLRPRDEEWEGRGFRACEASDPDGNLIQFREEAH